MHDQRGAIKFGMVTIQSSNKCPLEIMRIIFFFLPVPKNLLNISWYLKLQVMYVSHTTKFHSFEMSAPIKFHFISVSLKPKFHFLSVSPTTAHYCWKQPSSGSVHWPLVWSCLEHWYGVYSVCRGHQNKVKNQS